MTAPQKSAASPFDAAELVASMAGDLAALKELLRLCLEADLPRFLGELDSARRENDLQKLRDAAHGIRGLVGELAARGCYRCALQLEQAAENGAGDTEQLAAELDCSLRKLGDALEAFRSAL